jgi:FkbM family methyltransferase
MEWKLTRAIRALAGVTNPRTWGTLVRTYESTKFDYPFDYSWSQGGEDLGLVSALRGISKGSYIDVGAHHPSRFSVTRKLYNFGWTGINLEANKSLLAAFERERPNDLNIWACVGTEKEYRLTIFEEPALSTVNQEWRATYLKGNRRIASEMTVPGISLRQVFDKYLDSSFPDLLCIDAEGADLDVLKSANLTKGNGPEWLLLEADPPLSKVIESPAVAYALHLGYEIHLIMGMSTLLHMKSL